MNEIRPVKKRRLKKAKLCRFIFCVISLVFFLFCCIFYGMRLIKYYKIYNPKSETGQRTGVLSATILKDNPVIYEGDGLYRVNGSHLFKGKTVNNYIEFSNLMWRILRVNADNSVDIVLNEPINNLMWNSKITDYTSSDVHQYLNDVFLKILNQKRLKNTTICTDEVNDLSKITCNKKEERDYVKLLSITDYLNSKTKQTFVNDDGSLWLSDRSKTEVWYAKGNSVASYDPSESYPIKPVVTLKVDNSVIGGKGTMDDPYIIEKKNKEMQVGSYVKFGDAIWIAYEVGKENTKYILSDVIGAKFKFDTTNNLYNPEKAGSLAGYLNSTFYSKLSYKELLTEDVWYTGGYQTSYKDVYKKQVKAKVGLYNIADMKFGMLEKSYHLLTPSKTGSIYIYGPYLTPSKVNIQRDIRPAISVKNSKIKTGDGTLKNPFELEV